MTTNIDRAAEVIRAAGWDGGNAAEVLARRLADAGLITPDLPSDNTDGIGSGEWSAGFEYEGYSDGSVTAIHQAHASAWSPGWTSLSTPSRMTTDQAEAVALALLAAVRSDRQIAAAHATQEKEMTSNIDRAAKQDMTEPDFIKKHPVPWSVAEGYFDEWISKKADGIGPENQAILDANGGQVIRTHDASGYQSWFAGELDEFIEFVNGYFADAADHAEGVVRAGGNHE